MPDALLPAAASPPRLAWRRPFAGLLVATEVLAAVALAVDLLVVIYAVLARFLFDAPVVWGDDAARALLLALSFFGAAAALARGENAGVTFFVDRLSPRARAPVDAGVDAAVLLVAGALTWHAWQLLADTAGQTVGAGVPQELFFAPLCLAAACMVMFALERLLQRPMAHAAGAVLAFAAAAALGTAWTTYAPNSVPPLTSLMGAAFLLALVGGVPIAFVLALSALVFIWSGDELPGEFFAQQMARGIDNFVLLAIPFFILVGYLMEANGMSVRLIALLERLVGRMRGGLNVVMVLAAWSCSPASPAPRWRTWRRSVPC